MIQVRQTEDDLTAKGLLVLLAHASGLHVAGMLGRVRFRSFWPVLQESSVSAQARCVNRKVPAWREVAREVRMALTNSKSGSLGSKPQQPSCQAR
jgi:hypothetical protein